MDDRRVLYAEAAYGEEEIEAVNRVLRTQRHRLVTSEHVEKFESEVAQVFGKKHGLMVNSGSSANLIALQSFKFPKGGEVITPALTFSTTVAPIFQSQLVPVFVDSDFDTLQANIEEVKAAITDKTVAIMIPNLIGNLPNWDALGELSRSHGIPLIEDSADTIGYKIDGTYGNTISDVSTTSFYASHVITGAGVGGMVCFDDDELLARARSLRSWGRRSSQYGETEDIERRLASSIEDFDYDDKYVFDDIGYNFIPSEISAAFALEQLKKLPKNIEIRNRNFHYLKEKLSDFSNSIKTFETTAGVDSNWLAFPICLVGKLAGRRKELQMYLEQRGIQTRTIFTGNVMKHPIVNGQTFSTSGSSFEVANEIMRNGILLGCHNSLEEQDLDYMVHHVSEFLGTL